MSYRQSFIKEITVSGSKTIQSENGGLETVHFTETVPVQINLYVDTNNFDESIAESIVMTNAVNGAVSGMSAAQCAEILNGSQKISNKISSNFMHLINTDFSVKKTENYNKLKASGGLLKEIATDIVHKHTRMNSDLARVRKHYEQIFNKIDEDCEKRVYALDKDSFILQKKIHQGLINDPAIKNSTVSFQQMQENALTREAIVTACLQKKTSKILTILSQFVQNTKQYEKQITDIMSDKEVKTNEQVFIPIMYCKEKNSNFQTFSSEIPEIKQEQITLAVSRNINDVEEERWKVKSQREIEQIDRTIKQLIEKETMNANNNEFNSRVNSVMNQLWQTSCEKMKSFD